MQDRQSPNRKWWKGSLKLSALIKISQHTQSKCPYISIWYPADMSLSKYSESFVHFFGWFQYEYNIYLAMEYISYGDLGKLISKCVPISGAGNKSVTTQVLNALVIMHRLKICYRDLKPDVRKL
jgi:serine/threonine protein kinase